MILVSIIGDSLSTFEGFNPPNYAVFYDKRQQSLNGLTSVYDTWWAKVNQAIHAFLCINNSYSGSRVTGNSFPAGSSIERISELKTAEYDPDIILLYIGFNDFGNGIKIRRKQIGLFQKPDLSFFEEAYAFMIDQIKEQYPGAKIVCGTLLRSKLRSDKNWEFPERYAGIPLEEYNNAIRKIAKGKKVFLADVGAYESRYETLDGSHPTAEGHKTIAEAWIKSLVESDVLEPSAEACIKLYSANRNHAHAVFSVFEALSREKVLMAFNNNHVLVTVPYEDSAAIPVFTSPNEIRSNESMRLKPVFLRDIIETILALNMPLIVNPFSESDKQFFIPYESVKERLKPLIDGRRKKN